MDTYLVATHTDVAAVHVFGSKVVIVRKNGVILELPRVNGSVLEEVS